MAPATMNGMTGARAAGRAETVPGDTSRLQPSGWRNSSCRAPACDARATTLCPHLRATWSYLALAITLTASAGVPAAEVALTRYATEDALDVPRVTTTLSVQELRAAMNPVE